MARVIAGTAGGRRLVVPPGRITRPTSDRAREGLFSALETQLGSWRGARFLDLYAGSGAVGLEALSRGAAHVLLVEADSKAVRTIRNNIRAVDLPGVRLHGGRVERLVADPCPGEPYDVVFLDPPYCMSDADVRAVLESLQVQGWLAAQAIVIVERESRGGVFVWPSGFDEVRSRRYGEGTFWYGLGTRP
jgi:16S rRNA (guanine966-N2)-methyltransferase